MLEELRVIPNGRQGVCSRMQRILICFSAKWIFVQTISQFEFRLSKDSAVISSRNAMSTPPPWEFPSFLMAT